MYFKNEKRVVATIFKKYERGKKKERNRERERKEERERQK